MYFLERKSSKRLCSGEGIFFFLSLFLEGKFSRYTSTISSPKKKKNIVVWCGWETWRCFDIK